MKLLFSSIAAILLLTSFSDWKTRYDKDGVLVMIKSDGIDREILATVEVNATIDQCIATLKDIEKLKRFSYRATLVRLVAQPSDDEWVVYTTYGMPALVKDRDVVVNYSTSWLANGNVHVNFKSVDGYVPETSKFKRQDDFTGAWKFEKISPKRTKVTYTALGTTDGFPGWLVNLFITSGPKHTMIEFREEVAK